MKKFFIFYLSIIILCSFILPLNSARAAKYRCYCRCRPFSSCSATDWPTDPILTSADTSATQDHMCYLKCQTTTPPAGCTLGSETPGYAQSCEQITTCQSWNPNYSCVDVNKREGGDADCETELCTGASNIKCCPPVSAAPAKGGAAAPAPINLTNPIAATNVPQLIGSIIKEVLGIVGALALLMFVYGGFLWLTSGGSPDRIKKGKDILVWAVIGLVVIFASYTLVDFVIKALGV
jgi:hypothetical protein